MGFSIIEQETSDISWFFVDINNQIGFVASGGGKLPNSIANSSYDYNLSLYFNKLPDSNNYELGKTIQKNNLSQYYSFIQLAKKGLYCFDKTNLNDHDDTNYHLVVKPIKALKIKDITDKSILKLLKLTKANLKLNDLEHLDVALIN